MPVYTGILPCRYMPFEILRRHVENEIYIIQESNPLIPLVGRDLSVLSFEHGPTTSGAALGMLWFTGEENESSSQ